MHIFSCDEEEAPARDALSEGAAGERLLRQGAGWSPRSLRLNGYSVSRTQAQRYGGRGIGKEAVPDERAQARNLGGTAKQPFALNEGERLFFQKQVYKAG